VENYQCAAAIAIKAGKCCQRGDVALDKSAMTADDN
jgi:hypothetical protein